MMHQLEVSVFCPLSGMHNASPGHTVLANGSLPRRHFGVTRPCQPLMQQSTSLSYFSAALQKYTLPEYSNARLLSQRQTAATSRSLA